MTYIGGEQVINPDLFRRIPVDDNDYKIRKKFTCWTDTGRSAITLALGDIKKRGSTGVAWLPRYACSSVSNVFIRSGFTVKYYSLGPLLDDVSRMPSPEKNDVFLFIHYFGFRNNKVAEWLALSGTSRKAYVIEDCVQASLSENVGDLGNYAIYSYRKFLAVPDGAVLSSDADVDSSVLRPSSEGFVSRKAIGKLMRALGGQDDVYLKHFIDAEGMLEDFVPRECSALSRFLRARISLESVRSARRKSWNRMCEALRNSSGFADVCKPFYTALGQGDVPLGLPVRAERRDLLRQFLAGKGIFCPIHWKLPPCDEPFEEEQSLSDNILTLPADQGMGETDAERVCTAIADFYSGSAK